VPDRWVTIPNVTETTADDGKRAEPPVRAITANQVVAWNLARYRRSAGLTQYELETAIGWGKGAVSDAERSWKGSRVREFDAHTMTLIALALGIPVIALLLPPDGDGHEERWVMDAGPDRDRLGMGEYLTEAVLPDGPEEGDGQVLDDYRNRYDRAIDKYVPDPRWAARAARFVKDRTPRVMLAELAARLRRQQDAALDSAAVTGEWASAIEKELGGEE
jgi:transcriptional regulator with XRE-family HTH domain